LQALARNLAAIRQIPRPAYIIASVGSPIPVLIPATACSSTLSPSLRRTASGPTCESLNACAAQFPCCFHVPLFRRVLEFHIQLHHRSLQRASVAQYYHGGCLPPSLPNLVMPGHRLPIISAYVCLLFKPCASFHVIKMNLSALLSGIMANKLRPFFLPRHHVTNLALQSQ
jgi:hypothetical protein